VRQCTRPDLFFSKSNPLDRAMPTRLVSNDNDREEGQRLGVMSNSSDSGGLIPPTVGVHRQQAQLTNGGTVAWWVASRVILRGAVCTLVLAVLALWPPVAQANLPSEDNGLIAFQRNDDAHGEIWVLDPTAPTPEASAIKVTSEAAPEAQPAYSAKSYDTDAQDLAFQRFEGGNWDIWKRPTRGAGGNFGPPEFDPAVPLVTGPGNQEAPAYSDMQGDIISQSLLAYTSDQSGTREIWLRDATGATAQVTSEGGDVANPDFAGRFRRVDLDGDGTTDVRRIGLAFETARGGQHAIWAVDIDVAEADGRFLPPVRDLRLIAAGPAALSEPSWQVTSSSDDSAGRVNDVLFTTLEAGTSYLDYVEQPYDVLTGNALSGGVPFLDQSTVTRYLLTGAPGGDSGAVWAPFGDQIAFTRTGQGNADLWVMSANGENARRLTERPGPDINASWQPASESSAEVVGGHTYPGPVTRPKPDGSGGGGSGGSGGGPGSGGGSGGGSAGGQGSGTAGAGAESRRSSPRLTITRTRWHAGRVRVSGRAARGLHGRVRVSFSCGRGRSRHTAVAVRSRSGRFRATLRAPRACRRARRGTVAVRYGGDTGHRSQRVTRRLRRR
jgi:hypothetical protein